MSSATDLLDDAKAMIAQAVDRLADPAELRKAKDEFARTQG